ncbi:ATP-dependent DNA helicase [Borrelia sp. P9F1]|uniref:ATP-dependent DNA helicase n=1 Tax=Borrelia sp. P9F1 TaxID=3058374 RepID=UPI00264904BF|nr:helicase C-terminal domain-containing protein [Borrelia sp. P9F1]WKC58272.1 helicase C-terminal domain-containing protein [Borrelia sp. P9F1]
MNLVEYILKKIELNIKGFAKRKPQLKMIEEVSKAFENENFLVIEAPTGTGKSLAYLISAIDFIQKTQEKVIISTASINLQEQLIKKDIRSLEEIIPFKIKFGLIKGMRNYLCTRRLEEFERSLLTYTVNKKNLESLFYWAKNTKTGDKDELNFIDEKIWEEVSASTETCSGMTCPDENKCFFKKARRKAIECDIIITNHHLLLNDLYIRNGILTEKENFEDASEKEESEEELNLILPNIKNIIIDEAHYLEEAARSLFSQYFSRVLIKQLFIKIDKIIRRQNVRGVYKKNFETATMLSFENIDYIIRTNENFPSVFRITSDTHDTDFYIRIKTHLKDIVYNLENYRTAMGSILQELEHKTAKIELERLIRSIEEKETLVKNFLSKNKYDNLCFWIENKKNIATFKTSEINLGPGLNKIMHKRARRIIFTSATLLINQSFSYFLNQTGLNLSDKDIKIEKLPYSFSYKERSMLAVTSDIETPDNEEKFLSQSMQYIKELVLVNEGGTLILLTSFKSLKYAETTIKDFLLKNDINLFIQGDLPKHELIDSFKRSQKKGVLIGIKNFWEGIDIKGDKLTMVIMPKLPFQTPSDPISIAKNELATKMRENFFTKETLPQAIMKFKQGFGRLIRDSADYGIIVCLDKRIFQKTYGRLFLQSLPDIEVHYSKFENIKLKIDTFFQRIKQNSIL